MYRWWQPWDGVQSSAGMRSRGGGGGRSFPKLHLCANAQREGQQRGFVCSHAGLTSDDFLGGVPMADGRSYPVVWYNREGSVRQSAFHESGASRERSFFFT